MTRSLSQDDLLWFFVTPPLAEKNFPRRIGAQLLASTNLTTTLFHFAFAFVGLKTAFVRRVNDLAFIAEKCTMVPIEWVTRRIATGSFLKRHEGVQEGHRFSPPKLELFFKVTEALNCHFIGIYPVGKVCNFLFIKKRKTVLKNP